MKDLHFFIYDAKGYEIRCLNENTLLPNIGTLTWDGKDEWGQEMPAGTYFLYAIKDGRRLFGEKVVKE